jgi:hypothetical protein
VIATLAAVFVLLVDVFLVGASVVVLLYGMGG